MAIASAYSISLGPVNCDICQMEDIGCSISSRIANSRVKTLDGCRAADLSAVSFRCKNPFLGSTVHGSSVGRDLCPSKISVAADYSDSVPESSKYASHGGYHPLEELKACRRTRNTKLSSAEIARTTVEASSSALLVFPGSVHSEPHEENSWAESQYVVDDYGDIFFEIFDDENILLDRGASNPVNALIGMESPLLENDRISGEHSISGIDDEDIFPLQDDDYFEVVDSEAYDVPVDWGMPDTSSWVHPIYFSKCLTKAVNIEYNRKMDHPSNGVSIIGCLRPAFSDEETYIRRLFHYEDGEDYSSDEKDDDFLSFRSRGDRSNTSSTLYRLEIMRLELYTVYGDQFSIGLHDFQDAEPDILVHSTSELVERITERGNRCNTALKALCKKKGIAAEGANLIGVDSLGMDVRVFCGAEAQTHRFPFKARARSEVAAEKQIQQLLFPRSQRKKFKSQGDGVGDSCTF